MAAAPRGKPPARAAAPAPKAISPKFLRVANTEDGRLPAAGLQLTASLAIEAGDLAGDAEELEATAAAPEAAARAAARVEEEERSIGVELFFLNRTSLVH